MLTGETVERTSHEDISNKKGLKDDLLTSVANRSVEAVETMELNEYVCQQFHVSEPKMAGFRNQLKGELQNGPCDQKGPQKLHRSKHLKPKNIKDEYVKDSIYSSNIRRDATRKKSIHTYVYASECVTESNTNVCDKKISSDKRGNTKEEECGGRALKEARKRNNELVSVNVLDRNEKNTARETKNPTVKHLEHHSKDTHNRRQNKENIKNIKSSMNNNISVSKTSSNNPENVKNFRASPENRQKGHSPTSVILGNSPNIITSPAQPAQSLALESNKIHEIISNVDVRSRPWKTETDCGTKSSLNFKISVNEEGHNMHNDIPGNFYSPGNITEKKEIVVLKSPLNSKDSQSLLSTQEKMELSAWGLPDEVLKVMWNRESL